MGNSRVYIRGCGHTSFGWHEGSDPLDLMAAAVQRALADAALELGRIDAVVCGYATTMPHLMLSTVLCERLALQPGYAHTIQLGGASGTAMVMLARALVQSGKFHNVLVVGGENRLTGQSRDASIQTLAQVGHPDYEVPYGASVPAYYALLASEYFHRTGGDSVALAELAVLMRKRASEHEHAHLRTSITVEDVLASKMIAMPLRILDCCPISDGSAALVISDRPGEGAPVEITGAGQAHQHQHITAINDFSCTGARRSASAALDEAGISLGEVNYLGIYDSFTITLAMLLEEIGLTHPGRTADDVRAGRFDREGELPLNTHGGLLSFGHSGVAGGMMHTIEAYRQLAGVATVGQIPGRTTALVHADGGVMSSHVSLVLRRT